MLAFVEIPHGVLTEARRQQEKVAVDTEAALVNQSC